MEQEEVILRKEYFMQARDLNDKIKEQREYIEKLRETLYSIGGCEYNERVQTSLKQDRFAEAFAKIEEEEEYLKKMEENCALLKFELINKIYDVKCSKNAKKVSELFFTKCLSTDAISIELGYSKNYISKMINDFIKYSLK